MRSVITAADDGNSRAQLAIDLFCHRSGRAILGLAASLTSIDGVIFTGGVGEAEFAAEEQGYTATRHQREVDTGYFDEVSQVISAGESSATALHGAIPESNVAIPS